MKRPYGTGQIYEKSGAYYGRWRTADGRRRNRRLGPKRATGSSQGLTRAMAERALRQLQESDLRAGPSSDDGRGRTVDEAVDALRDRIAVEGGRKSYRQNCESMQRVHISPALGSRRVADVSTAEVEALARSMLRRGLAPKTVRNAITFLHGAFALAVERSWCMTNPVTRAARPRRRRSGDASPDLQFLTVHELEAVLAAIPNEVVRREPAPTRRGRRGPAPPPPPDVLGPVLRVLILAAAVTGLRQSELLGVRWRDIDLSAHRVRVRNAFVRGEHSSEGKSDLSTRRSVPMADWLARRTRQPGELRTPFDHDDDLVFAHPERGKPLDRTKVSRRFKAACREAGRPGDPLPRPPAHVRHFARGLRRAAASDPGIPRPRGPEDNADLRPLRAGGVGGRHGQLCVPAWTERRTVTSTAVPRARR